jgi:hypothetical protein
MTEHGDNSIAALIRGVVEDARELIREEIALAKAEVRREAAAAKGAGVAFGGAALAAGLAVVLLSIALGGAVADLFEWPPWAGHGLVALSLGAAAYLLYRLGSSQASAIKGLPKTTASVRENIAWIRSKSSDR